MKLLLTTILLLPFSTYAQLSMKPGQWKVQTTVKADGKTIDPTAKMREAFANMPPEKRKQMEEMMAKMASKQNAQGSPVKGFGFDKDGMTVCYTEDMVKEGLDFEKEQKSRKCEVSNKKISSTAVSFDYKCPDGASGSGIWNIKDGGKTLDGKIKSVDKKGRPSEMNFKGQFVSSSCK